MKQLVILLVSLSLIVFAGIWEGKYLDMTSQYVLSDINYSKNAIDNNNFDLAKSHIKDTQTTWNEIKEVWIMVVEHNEIDKIEDALVKYEGYIENKDKTEALVYAKKLEQIFRHISEKQKISIGNVF
ncbi:MAG: DUF4363 family protein [Clostridia bacterium]|nr:DUF4363 family protein [Clostridia bacterium]